MNDSVKSAARVLDILELLFRSEEPMALKDLVSILALPKSSAHALLRTLQSRGYVERELKCLAPDGRLVIIAVQGGTDAKIDAGLVLRHRLTITGSTLRPRPVAFKSAIAASLRRTVWPWLAPAR